jgi:transcriptional regulator with XRE-family HTH domain
MRPNIRDVRKRKGLSLGEVASRCTPPTTPQTIGRLETGMRTLSLAWVDRIASALDVRPDDLFVRTGETSAQVAAVLRRGGAYAPKLESTVAPAEPGLCDVAVTVEDGTGEYRSGDQIWCERITVEAFKKALNRDILVRTGGFCLAG